MTAARAAATGPPIAFGHRGALGHGLENTIEAFVLARRLGATGIETDAWLAADGVPVLVHDGRLSLEGRPALVSRRTSAELGRHGIPTLADLYTRVGTDLALSLDVKHPQVVRPTIAVARQAHAVERLWICHETLDLLAGIRRWDRDVRLVLSRDPRGLGQPFDVHVERMADLELDALNMRWRNWTPERIQAVHAAGLRAFAWDVIEPTDIDRLLDLEVDAIYCDYPERPAGRIALRHHLA
jgi:glycerophosphoryl diester phosphodiesterase